MARSGSPQVGAGECGFSVPSFSTFPRSQVPANHGHQVSGLRETTLAPAPSSMPVSPSPGVPMWTGKADMMRRVPIPVVCVPVASVCTESPSECPCLCASSAYPLQVPGQ